MNAKKLVYQLFALVMIAVMVASCAPAATAVPTAVPATAAPVATAAPQPTAAPSGGAVQGVAGKVLYNVGFLKGHPVIRLMTLGFVVGCEELGYKYKLLLSDGSDYATMSASMEQAIAEKADGIVSFASDPSLKPVIERAGKAGIPVVSAHFPQKQGDYPGLTAWVAADTIRYAQDVAASMGAELRKRGVKSGTIAVTQGNFNTVENLVSKTFTEEMNKNFPEFKILPAQEEGFDLPTSIAKASAIISANPDIVGAMSTTGAGPTTWARGAEETGKKDGEIVIISMDYTRPNLDLVKAGKVYGLVGQPLFQEFHDAVYILDKVFKGEKFEYANPFVAPIITLKDLDTYYKLNDDVEAKLGAGANAAATPAPAQVKGVAGKVLYNVGFLKGHPVIRLMTLGFVVGCEELGYKYKLLLSDGSDYATMSASMEQAIAEKADGIVSFASDPSLKPVIERAGKAGIPVVSAHFPQKQGDYPGLTAWVAADTIRYAQDVAASMGAELRKRGVKSGTIAVTQGNFNTVENLVSKTFTEEMNKNFPEFKILPAQEEGFDLPTSIAKASAIISANPDIVGAMSTTGAGPTTWARGAEETGKKDGEIVIISMDYTRPNLDLVKAGKVYGLVGQPLFQEFHDAVYILDKVFKGEKFEYANPFVAPIITLKDLDTYYKLNDDVEAKLGAGANAAATPAPAQVKGVAGKVLYNVGFLKGHPVIRLMTLGFVVGCEELGYKYKLLLSDGSDYATMSASMEQAIAEKADGIVSFASDPSLKPVIERAGKAGIPVVSAHFPQKQGDYPGLTAWVAADTIRYAQDVAASMGAELRKRGVKSGTIAVTQGNFNTVENLVSKTFTEEMNKNFPEFKILPAQEEGFDLPTSIAKASAIISANPDIVGAMSTTGAGPTTWARGAEETGKKDGEIVIISMDYTRPNLDLVKAGKVYGLVGQPLFQEFHDAVYILDKVFKGEKFEYANPFVAPIITLKDLDTYYKLNDDVEAKLGAGANAAATPTPKP